MRWEQNLLLSIHSHSSPVLNRVFLQMEFVGSTWFFPTLVTSLILWHAIRKQGREVAAWGFVGILTLVLQVILKACVARPRPALWHTLIHEPGYSFPSGHAIGAATFFPLLGWTLSRPGSSLRKFLVIMGVAAALVIGFSRLYLGVHWPTDVLSAWTIGFALSASAMLWLKAQNEA